MAENKFSCKRCGYDFTTKQNLIYHLRKKLKCNPIINNIDIQILLNEVLPKANLNPVYTCIHCKKLYTNRISKYQHQSKCKVILNNIDNTNALINNKEDKIINLENELANTKIELAKKLNDEKIKNLEFELLKKDKDLELMKKDNELLNKDNQLLNYKLLNISKKDITDNIENQTKVINNDIDISGNNNKLEQIINNNTNTTNNTTNNNTTNINNLNITIDRTENKKYRSNKIIDYLINNKNILPLGSTDISLLCETDGLKFKELLNNNKNDLLLQCLYALHFNEKNLSNLNTFMYENKFIAKMDENNVVSYDRDELIKNLIKICSENVLTVNNLLLEDDKINIDENNFVKKHIEKYNSDDPDSKSKIHDKMNENRYILSNLIDKNIIVPENENKFIDFVKTDLITPSELTSYCQENYKNKDKFDEWNYNKKYLRDYKYDCLYDKKTLKYVSNRPLLHEKLNSE